jgi:hypothetical protein
MHIIKSNNRLQHRFLCSHSKSQLFCTLAYWKLNTFTSALVVCWLSYVPLDPRFADSNLVGDDGFLRAIKICSTTFFGGELKLSAPCCKISHHVKEPCGIWKIFCLQNSPPFLTKFLLICYEVSAGISHFWHYTIPPHNINQYHSYTKAVQCLFA